MGHDSNWSIVCTWSLMHGDTVPETENCEMDTSEMENSDMDNSDTENSVLKCELCTHKFSSKPEWKMHMSAEHDTTVHFCDLCPKVYYTEAGYLQHFDEVHKAEFNRHTCSFCGVSYKWFKFLETHIQRKHLVHNLKQCAKCGEEFYNTLAYLRHLKLKHAPGRVFHKCGKCFRSFTAKSYVALHERFDHNPEGLKYFQEYAFESLNLESEELLEDLTKCSKCNLKFSSAMYLYKHLKLVHNQKKFYQCCICQDAVYGTRTGVTIHLFHEHNVSREHKCTKCTTALFESPSNKKVKNEAVKPVTHTKNWQKPSLDTPSWSRLFIKQGIPENVDLTNANETEISNLRNNIQNLFHILSSVPPSKLKGTTPTDLHVDSVFSIKRTKRDDRRRHQIVANPENDVENEMFLSNAVQNEKRRLKKKKRNRDKIDGVLTVVRGKDGNQKYQCDICHHEFSYRKGLKAHVIFRHGFNGHFNFKRPKSEVLSSKIIENSRTEFDTTHDNNSDSSLGEITNDSNYVWNDVTSPGRETNEVTEALQIDDNSDTSQKENKCDDLDDDSNTSTNVNISNIAQKVNTSNTTPRGTKLLTSPKFDKLNTLEIVNESMTTHKVINQEKNRKVNKLNTTEKVTKSDTTPKITETEKTSKFNKSKTPKKVNESNTTFKVAEPEKTQKVNKSNSDKVNACNTMPQTGIGSNTASKLNKSNETSKRIKTNKRKKPNETVISSEDNSCTPKKVKKYDATLKENKSNSPSVLKYFKIPKVTKDNSLQIEKSSAIPKATQTETAEVYIEKDPKINKFTTQQEEHTSATSNKDNSLPSEKVKKIDASKKGRTSKSPTKATLVNGSKSASKITRSDETPKLKKLEKINKTVISPEGINSCTLNKVKKYNSTLKENESYSSSQKSYKIPKATKVNLPQIEKSNVTAKATQTETSEANIKKDPKINKLNTQQEDDKSTTSNKDNSCIPQKAKKPDASTKINELNTQQEDDRSATSNKDNSCTPQKTKETDASMKINKFNTQQKDDRTATSNEDNSCTPQNAKKTEVSPKGSKLETPTKATLVNGSNTASQLTQSNETLKLNKRPVKILKVIKVNTPQINKSDVTAKVTECEMPEVYIETQPKINEQNNQQKEDKSATSIEDKPCTPQKAKKTAVSTKINKLSTQHEEDRSATSNKDNSCTPQKTKKTDASTKINKLNMQQEDDRSATSNKDNSFTPQKAKKTDASTKINQLNRQQNDDRSATSNKHNSCTPQKAKKTDVSQKRSKLETPTKATLVNESNTASQLTECNETPKLNKKPVKILKVIKVNTPQINKSDVTPKVTEREMPEVYIETQPKTNDQHSQQNEDKSVTSIENNSCTPQKDKKIDGSQKRSELITPTKATSNISDSDTSQETMQISNMTQMDFFPTQRSPEVSKPVNITPQTVTIGTYKCMFCQIQFEDQLLLLNHLTESHSDTAAKDGGTIYKCIDCGIAFQQKDSLDAHVKEYHANDNISLNRGPNTCLLCNRIFKNKRGLLVHNLRTHNVKNVYSCKKCNFKHTNKRKLTNHPCVKDKIGFVLGSTPTLYPRCEGEVENNEDKILEEKDNSRIQEVEYEKIKDELLKMCKKEIGLKNLEQEKSKKLHKCLKCERKFPKRTFLLSHIKNDHKINLFKLHKCDKCNSVFKMADKLTQHIKLKHKTIQQKNHLPVIKINKSKLSPIQFTNGRMPNILSNILYLNGQMHTCGICNSYFSKSELLQRHIQWEHTKNVNLHKCGQCSQVLYNVEDLEMHMASAHNSPDGIFKWKKQIAYNYEQQTDL